MRSTISFSSSTIRMDFVGISPPLLFIHSYNDWRYESMGMKMSLRILTSAVKREYVLIYFHFFVNESEDFSIGGPLESDSEIFPCIYCDPSPDLLRRRRQKRKER
jgi:hypothetical protein